ncbi:MAG: bifunctional riboflavin kinase/FAD synthetase [Cyclonatronaceae bacterium]
MSSPVFIHEYQRNPANVLTVGTFDGVHLGHQALIENVVRRARKKKAPAVVVTFDPHPREVINPASNGIRLLTTLKERAAFMQSHGIDHMVVIPFTRDFSILTSGEFIRYYIHDQIGVDEFVIGYDHHFGRDREGSINTLRNMSRELGFSVHVVEAHEVGHITVSSTVIRKLLENEGDVESAARMLGRCYEVSGTIVKGDQRGRTIGFPTANLEPENRMKILPAHGVYHVEVMLEGQCYYGMMNIGVRPTFSGEEKLVPEVHIFDFSRMVYGSQIRIRFLRRIRGEKKFNSVEALVQQLVRDRETCQRFGTGNEKP